MALNTGQFARSVRHSDEQIKDQLGDCQRRGWALIIEHTADPDPENLYWERWGVPIHDPDDPQSAMFEIISCRNAFPRHYIRVNACEAGRGQAVIRHSLLVHTPQTQRQEDD